MFVLKWMIGSLVSVSFRSKAGQTELRSDCEPQRRDFRAEKLPEAAAVCGHTLKHFKAA